jgi:4-hydroxybenzoate polyprenyltransferase
MFDINILLRLLRIREHKKNGPIPWIFRLFMIFPLVFLISRQNLFSYNMIIVFVANFLLTASGFALNDVEDAEDDYHDPVKNERNPIANGELSKRQGYLITFFMLFTGLLLLFMISPLVFLVGFILIMIGIFYSWKPVRLKSRPVLDVISHAIGLGILQLSTTYLTFRPFDLYFIPFLMIVAPASIGSVILYELRDFEVDKKTKINNIVQNFHFSPRKIFLALGAVIITGSAILITTFDTIGVLAAFLIFLGGIVLLRCDKFFKLHRL